MEEEQLAIVIFFFLTLMVGLASTIIVLIAYRYRKRKQDHYAEIREIEIRQKEEMLRVSQAAEEQERGRIAEELHDDINNRLTLAKLELSKKEGNMVQVVKEIDQTMQALRNLSHRLMPPAVERFGLAMALEDLMYELQDKSGLEVEVEIDKSAEPAEREKHMPLFRIVQELINNTIKYSEASQLKLFMTKKEGECRLIYTDNGKGFDKEEVYNSKKGMGLRNLESRASVAGAIFELRTAPGQGVKASVIWKE